MFIGERSHIKAPFIGSFADIMLSKLTHMSSIISSKTMGLYPVQYG